MRVLLNADRFAMCHPACATAWRIKATAQVVQSILVALTILIIVGTPLPSSPTIQPLALLYSISLEALDLLPSLSFRRIKAIEFRAPSESTLGTKKHERPRGELARSRNASHMGAEVNHLCPLK